MLAYLGVCAAAWRRRSHEVVRSTAVHCYEHKQYPKHFNRYLKHMSMTNKNERRLRASEAGDPLSRVAPAVTGRTGTGSASPGGARSRPWLTIANVRAARCAAARGHYSITFLALPRCMPSKALEKSFNLVRFDDRPLAV